MKPELSVIISNRNDIAMLAVTIRSCIESFRPFPKGFCEIVICDNSDEPAYELVKAAIPSGYIKEGTIKLLRQTFPCLFSARETAARHAQGKYILCLDSHMLVGRHAFTDLYTFMEQHSDDETLGFAHAPINWAHQHESRSKHDRDMSVHELGDWNSVYKNPHPMTWKGMPWICRREWFLSRDNGIGGYGALSKYRVSWGGGDMHIGIKPWLLGYVNWAVPTDPCIHIGPFPKLDQSKDKHSVSVSHYANQDRYRLYAKSGNFPHTFGFLVSCYVLGGTEMMNRNKGILKERFGRYIDIERWWDKAIEVGSEERDWLLKNQKISFNELLKLKPWRSIEDCSNFKQTVWRS